MPLLNNNQQRAAFLIAVLGLGLLIALLPYVTGLVGGLALYVVFEPAQHYLRQRLRPSVAAALVAALALVLLVVPGLLLAGVIVDQAQDIAGGVIKGPLLIRLSQLRVGEFELGPRLAGLGEQLVTWIGTSAFALIGTATRLALNLVIALFCLYFLLLRPQETWDAVKPYIPFSSENAEKLRVRFHDVTASTVIGTILVAAIQGALVAVGFWLTGLSNAAFWGVVTAVLGILPVVGGGLVWGPGALNLALSGRPVSAIGLFLLGAIIVGNVDVVVRPMIFRRFAQIHPLVTLIGAIGGIGYFGLLGILIGPLAVSYFFELIRMYKEEYLTVSGGR